MIVLYILLALVGLFFLLLCFPVRVHLQFDEELAIRINYLFFRYQVTPKKEDKKRKAEKNPEEEQEKKSSFLDIINKRGLQGFLETIREFTSIARDSLQKILPHTIVERLNIQVLTVGEDAAQTAMMYGAACSVIYGFAGYVVSNSRCSNYSVEITPGFDAEKSKVYCDIRLHVRLYYLNHALLSVLLKYIMFSVKKRAKVQD